MRPVIWVGGHWVHPSSGSLSIQEHLEQLQLYLLITEPEREKNVENDNF